MGVRPIRPFIPKLLCRFKFPLPPSIPFPTAASPPVRDTSSLAYPSAAPVRSSPPRPRAARPPGTQAEQSPPPPSTAPHCSHLPSAIPSVLQPLASVPAYAPPWLPPAPDANASATP